jgi:hypothetical protein
MTITMYSQFDCTQRELVINIAKLVYRTQGCILPADPLYLWKSQHPTEQGVLHVAEAIFEMFYGDSPEYIDDPEELSEEAAVGIRNEIASGLKNTSYPPESTQSQDSSRMG